MTSQQANNISIKAYLAGMDIHPMRDKPYYGMYHSPFRPENNPSLKVDYRKNLWYDFGAGEGGTMIDLVMKINRCTFPQAMKKLEGREMPSFSPPVRSRIKTGQIIVKKILPLTSNALIGYLWGRSINTNTARGQCVEIHYSVDGKEFFAIGFRNDAGGYELRNRYFKGSVSPKDITTFPLATSGCMVFEGFMDYLSYLTLKEQLQPQIDTVVLNSVVHLGRTTGFLQGHSLIYACMDNDPAGKRALSEILSSHHKVRDMSEYFKDHKDLNEYLCDKTINKTKVINHPKAAQSAF